jgi:hypothetical protein
MHTPMHTPMRTLMMPHAHAHAHARHMLMMLHAHAAGGVSVHARPALPGAPSSSGATRQRASPAQDSSPVGAPRQSSRRLTGGAGEHATRGKSPGLALPGLALWLGRLDWPPWDAHPSLLLTMRTPPDHAGSSTSTAAPQTSTSYASGETPRRGTQRPRPEGSVASEAGGPVERGAEGE